MNLEELVIPVVGDDSRFKSVLKTTLAGVAAAAAAMGLAVRATFKWADELDSLQDVMGVTDRTAAALNFTLRKSGVDTSTLAKGMVILEKNLVDASGRLDTTGKNLKKWGINVLDSNKKLKDQETLLGEITQKYSSFATQQEKVNFLTEVFGKSGAELIDFFDVLAQEGGIDAVTKKVEALGLAISPDRYEKFNRSLEELKLIGLGLAVGFTEKVMPTLERFVGWFTDFAQNPDISKVLKDLDTFGFTIIQGMANSINKWVSKGGPEEFSNALISIFDDIGDGGEINSKALAAADKLLKAISNAFSAIDWSEIANSFDQNIGEALDRIDWAGAGDSIGDGIERLFSTSLVDDFGNVKLPRIVEESVKGLGEFFAAAIGVSGGWQEAGEAIGTTFVQAMDTAEVRITDAIRNSLLNSFAQVQPAAMGMSFSLAQNTMAMLSQGIRQGGSAVSSAVMALSPLLDDKLRQIAKVFYSRAWAWTNQIVMGFNSGVGAVLATITALVGKVNSILRKIQTKFVIDIILGSTPGATGGQSASGGGGNSGGGSTGGGSCFVPGTLITMSDGTKKPIEEVIIGDTVWSWHNNSFVETSITEILHHPPEDAPNVIQLNKRLTGTPDHLIFANQRWIAMGHLAIGDEIILDGKSAKVASLEYLRSYSPVYNLHTDHESHNYFANGILVHNIKASNRASTGAVIGGQVYGINLDDEVFVPSQNGRVERRSQERSSFEIDYNRLGSIIGTEVVKALNNY